MISKTRRQMLLTTASLGAASMAPAALAQSAYPNKTIRYIVPVAAGGGADMIGRATCERLAKVLGQSLVIENISGGGGAIACQNVARSNPDGYTLLQSYVATHGTAPKYAGKDYVNPGSEILSAEMMLRHMGWTEAADLIIKGTNGAIAAKTVTYDFERLMEGATLVSSSGFGEALIKHM